MTNLEQGNGTSRDDLLQRLALMETMIAEGRRNTGRFGWVFILWGFGVPQRDRRVLSLAAVVLGLAHPHWERLPDPVPRDRDASQERELAQR